MIDSDGANGGDGRQCPHYSTAAVAGRMRCALVGPSVSLISVGQPNNPCEQCRAEWIDGEAPTAESPTPTIVELLERTSQARHAGNKPRRPIIARPRRYPFQCDHGGAIVAQSASNCRKVYACDLRGEATCAKCTACPDFVPVDSLTAG